MNEDEMDGYIFCFIIFVQVVNLSSGQLMPQEELRNVTSCDLKTTVDVICGSSEVIAIHSLYFYYHPACDSLCCGYDSSHFSSGAYESFIRDVRRGCSGRNRCSLEQLDGVRDFGSAASQEPSYVVIKYYCIPASSTTSICSTATLTSTGDPLYITNENYPSVTTGNSTCSCSLEVPSCTSSVNLYIIDADLYLDVGTCEQAIRFVDGTRTSLAQINCINYYQNEIAEINIDTNYVKIDFIDNSIHNQEGHFFLGFGVSEDVAFKLSCSYQEQTVCVDCGVPDSISHGILILIDSSNSGYGALANVICENGYESDNATVSCLGTGQWENVTCSLKDCGTPYYISNGTITPVVNGSTAVGTRANVNCDEGFEIKGLCGGTQFQCGDGTCIDNSLRCDNFPDCDDKLDEILCDGQKSCLEGQVLCGTRCIDSQGTCDDAEVKPGTISCLVIGKWEVVKCSAKDCGKPPSIDYGSVTLLKALSTTYSSLASVTCQEGYKTSKQIIVCKETGSWERSSCDSDVDKTQILIVLVSVLSTLLLVVMIMFGLCVFWRYRKRQRKRKSLQEVNTYEEVIRHGEQHQYSDITMETQQ